MFESIRNAWSISNVIGNEVAGNPMKGAMSIRYIFAILLSAVVFFAVLPTIFSGQNDATNNTNITGAALTLVGLVGLVIVAVYIAKMTGKL